MDQNLKTILEDLKLSQDLARAILEMLTDEQLRFRAASKTEPLGEQFRHMIRVRFQYDEAIQNKKVGPVERTINENLAFSKEKLLELWDKSTELIPGRLKKMDQKHINSLQIEWSYWSFDHLNLFSHLLALLEHEYLHNGQIMVYVRGLDLKFPKNWNAWGVETR